MDQASKPVIAYIGGFEFPDKNAAASRALAVANLYSHANFEVVLYGTDRSPDRGPKDLQPVMLPSYYGAIWSVGYPRGQKEWLQQIVGCDLLLDHLDVTYGDRLQAVVFYNYPAVAQARALWRLRRGGKKAIADITEWFEDGPWTKPRAIIKNLDTRLRMHWVNPRMSALITTSPFLTRHYHQDGKPNLELPTMLVRADGFSDHVRAPRTDIVRLFFAGSGFDPDIFAKDPESVKDRLDWCLELLHMAHQTGARFVFDIFGVDAATFLQIFPHLSQALNDMGGAVIFHGRQPRAALMKTLWDADYAFFLRKPMLSTNAGFPTKLSEPLTHGVPVLTNPMENVLPFMTSGTNGDLIDVNATDRGLSTLLAALQRSPAERHALHRNCFAQEPFGVDKFLDVTQAFLTDVIGKEKK